MPPEAFAVLRLSDGKLLEVRDEHSSALPGSTVKPFIPVSGIGQCKRKLSVAGHRLDCTHAPVLGPINGPDAVALSCNCYFAALALRISPETLRQSLQDFAPQLARTDDQRQLQALGMWGVSATPLRLARAYARLLRTDRGAWLGSGKTGTTAQAAWYAGWAPPESPGVVVAAMTGGRGVTDAKPAAERLLAKWLR